MTVIFLYGWIQEVIQILLDFSFCVSTGVQSGDACTCRNSNEDDSLTVT